MSNTQKLTIIAINSRNGVSAKTGRPYSMHEAQCILTEGVADATGALTEQMKVGRVNVADDSRTPYPATMWPTSNLLSREKVSWLRASSL